MIPSVPNSVWERYYLRNSVSVRRRVVFPVPLIHNHLVTFRVETEQETDGRWIGEIAQIPGALAYGSTRDEAMARVEALGLRVLAEQIEQGETSPELAKVFIVAA
jgi:predicted RNase H-like HicB family nuclease